METKDLDVDFSFVDRFYGGGANALRKDKRLIVVDDKPGDVDAHGKSDVNNIPSLRAGLHTGELIRLYFQSSQESFNLFFIE